MPPSLHSASNLAAPVCPGPAGDGLRLVAYLRVSTDQQAEKGYGLQTQKKAIAAWARQQGHEVAVWTSDEGVSGSNGIDKREGLYEALRAIQDHEADALVIYNLDRLARLLHVQEAVLAQVWQADAKVFSIEDRGEILEDDPEDPMRTAMRQMRGVFAQLERSMIRKRMMEGKRTKKAQGGYIGGAPPYGYSAVDGALVPDEDEQAALRRIVALHAQGVSLRGICKTMDAEGYRPKRSKAWHPYSVSKIIETSTA
jgi:DNA invertase Pin-like site-specific DNA recombinase